MQPATPAASSLLQRTEVAAEMEKLRAQMDELQSLLVRSAKNAWAAQRSVPEVADVYARLVAAEVDAALSKDIADRLEAAMATDAFFLYTGPEPEGSQNRWKILKSDPARVESFLRAELESRVVLRPRLGVTGAKGAVAVVVGPTGSGKTTSLAKLAVAASAQRPVRLVSLDRSRGTLVNGAQQLLSSLATPAITFSSVDSIEDLPKLVAEARKKECVLIDTPGFSASGTARRRNAGRRAGLLRRRRCSPGGAGLHESPRSAKFHRAVPRLSTFQVAGHAYGRIGNVRHRIFGGGPGGSGFLFPVARPPDSRRYSRRHRRGSSGDGAGALRRTHGFTRRDRNRAA